MQRGAKYCSTKRIEADLHWFPSPIYILRNETRGEVYLVFADSENDVTLITKQVAGCGGVAGPKVFDKLNNIFLLLLPDHTNDGRPMEHQWNEDSPKNVDI